MRKLSVLLLFLISLTVHTQEINEAYLDSLPVDMQQALLARIAEKEGNEEKVYRSIEASSDLKKKNIEIRNLKALKKLIKIFIIKLEGGTKKTKVIIVFLE